MRLPSVTWLLVTNMGAIAGAAETGIFEIDLLFPRNNEAYAPTDSFPIVFAVQNASLARYIYPSIHYQLYRSEPSPGELKHYRHKMDRTPANWTDDQPLFEYTYFTNFTVQSTWEIWWEAFWQICNEAAPKWDRVSYTGPYRIIKFTIEEGAKPVDLVAATAGQNSRCPGNDRGAAVNVSDKTMSVVSYVNGDWRGNDTCRIAESEPKYEPGQFADPCRVTIDAAAAESMAASKVCHSLSPPLDYSDIIVTLSTSSSTAYKTSTSYAEVLETVTEYSATSVVTVTVTAPVVIEPASKRANKRRGGCKPKTTTTLITSTLPATTEVPTTTEVPSTTKIPTTPSLPGITPIASGCFNLENYSSACSCIYAVSSTATITYAPGAPTEVVTITETSTVQSTSTSVITVVVSSSVIVPVTTTATETVTDVYHTTTTVTSTSVSAPLATYILVNKEDSLPRYLTNVNGNAVRDPGRSGLKVAEQISGLSPNGGQLWLTDAPTWKLAVRAYSNMYGLLIFTTGDRPQGTEVAFTCTAYPTGAVSCEEPTRGYDTFYAQGAATLIFGKSTFKQSDWTKVTLTWTTVPPPVAV
ncbi:hypothetical protein N0V88_007476 [Collariella sp. IMI 366227]|nr:hypothetical protein N0V88_007476 [Collariella sp. IMI 366227]